MSTVVNVKKKQETDICS